MMMMIMMMIILVIMMMRTMMMMVMMMMQVEAEKKFADSYQAAQLSMHSVMENEQEYVMQIHALSTSLNVGKYSSQSYKVPF